jgi:hypothetical protein
MAQVVEHQFSKCEALNSNSSTASPKKERERKKKIREIASKQSDDTPQTLRKIGISQSQK